MARLKTYKAPRREHTWVILSTLAVIALIAILVLVNPSDRVGLATFDEISDKMVQGQTQTYTLGGVEYEVTVVFVSNSLLENPEAKFLVNGELSDGLALGESGTLSTSTITVEGIDFEEIDCDAIVCPVIATVAFTLNNQGSGAGNIPGYVLISSMYAEGETKTFSIGGHEKEITLVYVSGGYEETITPPLAEPDGSQEVYVVVGANAPDSDVQDAIDLTSALMEGGPIPVGVAMIDTNAYADLTDEQIANSVIFILADKKVLITLGDNAGFEENTLYDIGLDHLQKNSFAIQSTFSEYFHRTYLLVENMLILFVEPTARFLINGVLTPPMIEGDHIPFMTSKRFEIKEILTSPVSGLVTFWIYEQRHAPNCLGIIYGQVDVLPGYVCCDGGVETAPDCSVTPSESIEDCGGREVHCENGALVSSLNIPGSGGVAVS